MTTRPAVRSRERKRGAGPENFATVRAVLDDALFATVTYASEDDTPVTIPTNFVRIDDCMYFHGKASSELIRRMSSGASVAVNVTIFDELVLARSAFNHSANYRSVLIFGEPSPISDAEEKAEILAALSEKYTPGRWEHIKQPSQAELLSTGIVKLSLHEAYARVTTGPPEDDAVDYANPKYWAGLIPLKLFSLPAIPDPKLLPGIPTPKHVMEFNAVPPLPQQQAGVSLVKVLLLSAACGVFAAWFAAKK